MIIIADLRDPWHPHEMFQTALFSAYCNKTLHYWFLFHTLLHLLQKAIIKKTISLKIFPLSDEVLGSQVNFSESVCSGNSYGSKKICQII